MSKSVACTMWAVVFGNNWEDIMYFSDHDRAKTKLIKQASANPVSFTPFILEYTTDEEGVFRRSKHIYVVHKKDQSNVFGIGPEDEIKML